MKISQIKKQSKKIIKGNVKNSSKFLILLISGVALFSTLPYLVDYFLNGYKGLTLGILAAILLLGFICLASFKMGSKAWFIFYNKKKRGAKAIYWIKPSKSVSCMKMYISLFFRKFIWALAFLSPGATIICAAVIIAINGGVEFNLFATWIAGGTVLFITGLLFLYFFLQRYFLVPYFKATNPSKKTKEIIAQSKEYMASNLKKAALLKISFLPWFLLGLSVIPSFYVWTYYSQSCALMASEIYKDGRKEKNTDSNAL